MKPGIKICGIRRIEDVNACNTYHPDYVGFMFWKESTRYVSPEQATILHMGLDVRIRRVGVFLDHSISDVAKIASSGIIDIVQLHGSEDDAYIRSLRRKISLPVIKAFSVKKGATPDQINGSSADLVLIDSGRGGTGEVFDWDFLRKIKRDYLLAGGLTPENAGEAAATGAFALDVSSGVETDGYKDADKIARFIANVRGQ
ncbi:phosphoribosylanthranilate isomerase [Ruminococcaceae bacterium YRB3002]|nr:phosphoribosylanthranilate isomerase [Ruminococcaceae bacterium YRB3002]